MIEKIITSKTRVKLLKLFLTHIDDRYYLRELERMLDESLSPLRRQLVKLAKMGILIAEQEANLKYYRLNRNFAGIEELRMLVLGSMGSSVGSRKYAEASAFGGRRGITREEFQGEIVSDHNDNGAAASNSDTRRRLRYDLLLLTVIAFFVLATAAFVVYTSTKSIKQVASVVSKKAVEGRTMPRAARTRPDEMVSKRWKVLPGNVPALSSGEAGAGKGSKEL